MVKNSMILSSQFHFLLVQYYYPLSAELLPSWCSITTLLVQYY